jgi:hypothetical protein
MSRERLTSRTAEDMKAKAGAPVSDKGTGIDNDAYNMNDTGHEKNDPKMDQYASGDPEKWAEGVNKDNPAKDDKKREETGHAPLIDKHAAAEAIASAKRLEERAVKCIIAAQRILPGAPGDMIEKQAAIFMHLPEEGLNATLTNQESLAKQIAKQASDVSEEAKAEGESEEQEKKEKEVEAAKKDMDDKKKKLEELEKQASDLRRELTAGQNADAMKNNPQGKKTEKRAGEDEKPEEKKEEEKPEEKAAASEEEKKEEEKKPEEKPEEKAAASEEEKKEEEKKPEEIEASDANLLDQIFGEVTASETKKGAAKLSGMVKKQASEQVSELSSLWASSPDVSQMF